MKVYIIQNPKTGAIIKVYANRTKARLAKKIAQKKAGVLLTIEEWSVS